MVVMTGRFASGPFPPFPAGLTPAGTNRRGKEHAMKKILCNPRNLLALFILCGVALLAALLLVSPYQGPVVAYKLALVCVAAIAGLVFDFLAFPYALPSSYLDRDWRDDPDAAGDDGQPDFPVAEGYHGPFCAALTRRALIIAAFVVAVALGL